MKLTITTPLAIVVDEGEVVAIRAEDASGGFGVLPGHAEFLTSLTISVVGWKRADASRHYCAVRRGVFTVAGTGDVSIATREAILDDNLATLHETVLTRFRDEFEAERAQHVEGTRLQLAAIRQIMRHLRANQPSGVFS